MFDQIFEVLLKCSSTMWQILHGNYLLKVLYGESLNFFEKDCAFISLVHYSGIREWSWPAVVSTDGLKKLLERDI